jgi:undecaprenyl-diphosphatase
MIETLDGFDQQLMLWLNYDGGSFLDVFWYTLSQKLSWVPFYIAIIAVMIMDARNERNWKKLIPLILFTALIIAAADQLASGLIKPLVQRPRPSHAEEIMNELHYVNEYYGGAYGFVSSHAGNTFALAVWISSLYRRRSVWIAMCTFALLNSYSRIYLGVHYPGDILGGALIGALLGWLGYIGYKKTCQRMNISPNGFVNPLPIPIVFWATIIVFMVYAAI